MAVADDLLIILDALLENATVVIKVAIETQEIPFIEQETASLLDYFGTLGASLSACI